MAVGFLFEAPGMTQEQYNQIMLGLNLAQAGADWPQGLISHAAGPMEGGWRVIDIWESEELARQFFQSRLEAVFQRLGVRPPPPKQFAISNLHVSR